MTRTNSIKVQEIKAHDIPQKERIMELIAKADKNGDGDLSLKELLDVFGEVLHTTQKMRKLKAIVAGMFATVILLAVATASVSVGFNLMLKEQFVDKETDALTSADGHVLAVAEAQRVLPLYAAPVLSHEELFKVRSLTLTWTDPTVDNEVVTSAFQIESTHLYNDTAVKFKASGGEEIFVWNGEAYLKLLDGWRAPVCAADVTCSAFRVANGDVAEAALAKAQAALEKADFPVPEDFGHGIEGRRLMRCRPSPGRFW